MSIGGEMRTVTRTDKEKNEDRAVALQLLQRIHEFNNPRWASLTAMALLSEADEADYVRFLTQPDPEIRERACRMIGFHRMQRQLPTLISQAKTDEQVRAAAVYAIGQMRASTSP